MRIAVTGASGQIGSQVVRLLAGEQAHQVVALSRRVLPDITQHSAQGPPLCTATADPADLADCTRKWSFCTFDGAPRAHP
jgi:NAD(P)-dependent dehydrogenase (short-subunit alcohol dehydrogenase family)